MSEHAQTAEQEPALPDMELIDVVEGMSAEERVQNKRRWLSEISDREMLCNLVDRVNEAEGLEVDIIY